MKAKMDVPASEVFGGRKASREAVQISVNVPKMAQQGMRIDMTTRGYGLKEKSRWMENTFRAFTDQEYWGGVRGEAGWRRVVVDSECIRVIEPVKEWFKLEPIVIEDALACAIECSYYGLQQEPRLVLDLSASSVLRTAILWRIGQVGPGKKAR
ncbi:hypothetical protein TK90_2776 (plasmid) [Thioalkalivibrio sp. K90mix]|uniref:hypothetical protein n=1 Tax=Thioalkalivibrio sp. (strain K90mix) TaxID=396595 RepID=UPI000195A68B|nr:hypothetical protein [Thioalkalivibrio sp. K90mix]ADC73261.1 hypothetical protein TK90_2776 [Thioalkalivibrio sp. K90mix]